MVAGKVVYWIIGHMPSICCGSSNFQENIVQKGQLRSVFCPDTSGFPVKARPMQVILCIGEIAANL